MGRWRANPRRESGPRPSGAGNPYLVYRGADGRQRVSVDEGLSRNGSFVDGQRVSGRRMLEDGDELRSGQTPLRFHAPFQVAEQTRVPTS
ncbi:MAG: FHA domain-containing protein [Solirubrobacterales bacterium]